MIHIIGTAHGKTQYWSDLIRKAESLDTCPVIVERFESYLQDAAISLNATAIAEENSKQLVDQLEGGSSVAKKVAEELDLRHAYCDPDLDERASLGVGIHKEDREPIWMDRIQPLSPNETSIIFVCGACHSVSFHSLLERNSLHARIHCQDWMETPQAQLSEDEYNEWRRSSGLQKAIDDLHQGQRD
jgi:hypothetical protein